MPSRQQYQLSTGVRRHSTGDYLACFDECVNGRAVATCQGSGDGSVNDPFIGFGGGVIERDQVLQRLFKLRLGLGGVAIFLCGRRVDGENAVAWLARSRLSLSASRLCRQRSKIANEDDDDWGTTEGENEYD